MNDAEKYPDDEDHGQDQDHSDNTSNDGTGDIDDASEITREHLSSGQAELDYITSKLKEACMNLPDEEMPSHIGRFEIERQLGRGAFSTVYLGYDPTLEKNRAIKLITRKALDLLNVDRERFVKETKLTAKLDDDPGIVTLYEANEEADGSLYFVLQYIEGTDLENKIVEKAYNLRISVEIVASVASSIHNAHKKRIVHRDLKPENILISDETGKPFVADFGLAVADRNPESHAQAAGTPAYMSPEQVEGKQLDGRSDIWSLGAILYRMVTGEHPFWDGDQSRCFDKIKNHAVKPPSQLNDAIDPKLSQIIFKCLEKKPGDRYQDAKHLSNDLKAWRPTKRAGHLVVAAIVLLLAACAIFFLGPILWPGEPQAAFAITAEKYDDLNWTPFENGARLAPDENLRFKVKANQKAYLYVFLQDDKGRLSWFFPSNPKTPFSHGTNPVTAGSEYDFCGNNCDVGLDLIHDKNGKATKEEIILIANPKRLLKLENWLQAKTGQVPILNPRGVRPGKPKPNKIPDGGAHRQKIWFQY